VITEFPLGDILCNKDANGRIVKWAIETSMYTLDFKGRNTIKSQALVDFMVEWKDLEPQITAEDTEHWKMYFYGSLNIDDARAGIYFISPSGETLCYVFRLHFPASHNVTEYEAAYNDLRIAIELGVKRLRVYGDSALVVKQVNKKWDANEKMDEYVAAIWKLENKFYGLEFHHVVRDKNVAADVLSKLGSTRAKIPAGVFVHDLMVFSVAPGAVVDESPPQAQIMAVLEGPADDWRIPFIRYLTDATIPQVHTDEDKVVLECLIRRSKHYILLDGKLTRKNAKEEIL